MAELHVQEQRKPNILKKTSLKEANPMAGYQYIYLIHVCISLFTIWITSINQSNTLSPLTPYQGNNQTSILITKFTLEISIISIVGGFW